jgi:ribonuclease HI
MWMPPSGKEKREEVWGFVARNEAGVIQCVGDGKIDAVSSTLQAEAIACLQALNCIVEQGMMSIELETDCLNLKNALLNWKQIAST